MNITLSKSEKEQIVLDQFHRYFQKVLKPFTINEFLAQNHQDLQSLYNSHYLRHIIAKFSKQGRIQQAFLKGERMNKTKIKFVSVYFSIPLEERNWDTEDERREFLFSHLGTIALPTKEERLFVEDSTKSSPYQKSPIYSYMDENKALYKQFVSIVRPYLPLLLPKEQEALDHLLDIHEKPSSSFTRDQKRHLESQAFSSLKRIIKLHEIV